MADHVLRLQRERSTHTAMYWEPEDGRKKRGRLKKTWQSTFKEDLEEMGASWHGACGSPVIVKVGNIDTTSNIGTYQCCSILADNDTDCLTQADHWSNICHQLFLINWSHINNMNDTVKPYFWTGIVIVWTFLVKLSVHLKVERSHCRYIQINDGEKMQCHALINIVD